MRVLHFLNELRPSGAETMLRAAASYWKEQGIEGEIVCTGEVVGSYADSLQAAGYRVHHLSFTPSVGFLLSIYGFLRRRSFDAVHIHTERGGFWYAAIAYLTGHRRIIRSFHGVFSFAGELRVRRYVQRLMMRRFLGVQMASSSESVRLSEQKTFHNASSVISNWFDSNSYVPAAPEEREAARAAWGVDSQSFVIASIGNCAPVKNHIAVLQALARIPKCKNVFYLHAGREQDGCPERVMADELGIGDRVRFLGEAPNVRAVLHASDLFVMPSLWEGFGIAAVEAMGAGIPVALADVSGLRDFRRLNSAIYWMNPTSAGVEGAILHFHSLDADERRRIGERLSAGAHQRYGIATGASEYAALYRGEPRASIAPKVAAAC